MIAGLSGTLLSQDALERAWPGPPRSGGAESARRRVRTTLARGRAVLGPSAGARRVFDDIALPLFESLGYQVMLTAGSELLAGWLTVAAVPVAAVVITPWGADAGTAWRSAVRQGIAGSVRWCFCVTGPALCVVDARRTYSRRHVEFDLAAAVEDPQTFRVLWALLSADALTAAPRTLDLAVEACDRYRSDVRASLQTGVQQALVRLVGAFLAAGRARRTWMDADIAGLFDESLIVVYRVLFLLFAEARGLVPRWHPVYRESYTIESLRVPAERTPRPRGIWEALQAIARLAHRGCRAGSLRVPPFNGRLFSPVNAPLADSLPLDDGAVRDGLLALTTRPSRGGMQRISYADLGVEQLGGVYERILDVRPAVSGSPPAVTLVRADARKTTGSFYTPRSLTEYVVRRTLAPLADRATPDAILRLRVLDPAMGSGAFLVAACRYLAHAYEHALVREGGVMPGDVTDQERAAFRRAIAQRCLFGVDMNPMAVQLARLSLWLATLAADKPLTFLDHHLRTGNSLVGASLADVARHPFGSSRRHRPALPLFDEALDDAVQTTIASRLSLANDPGDTLEQVREKERLLAHLDDRGPLTAWKTVADLWCARWFAAGATGDQSRRLRAAENRGVFEVLADELLQRTPALPRHITEPLLDEVRGTAERERFFHWTLEFPEVFSASGAPGFDAVVGNPPWEMLRNDSGDAARAALTARFARRSGVYRLQGNGHANLYQLFLERVLTLVRHGGRFGLVLPHGVAVDHGCADLRRALLDRTSIDTCVVLDNRDAIFPIHRGLKFVLLCASRGGRTSTLPLRSGIRSVEALDDLPDAGRDPGAVAVHRDLVERLSGPSLAIPDLRTQADADVVARIVQSTPALGDPAGWHVRFGRELNATDDRGHFSDGASGLPVIEGKHLRPFAVDVDGAPHRIPRASAAKRLTSAPFERPRLAYRDVAASTNRLTLIAAIVPAGVVTTHTLFCLKDPLPDDEQRFLCGMFNSYVANYLVRLRVATHVTVAIVERLPMPRPSRKSAAFAEVVELVGALTRDPSDALAHARLQARAASLYRLPAAAFAHVLSTFPLVDAETKAAALERFRSG